MKFIARIFKKKEKRRWSPTWFSRNKTSKRAISQFFARQFAENLSKSINLNKSDPFFERKAKKLFRTIGVEFEKYI